MPGKETLRRVWRGEVVGGVGPYRVKEESEQNWTHELVLVFGTVQVPTEKNGPKTREERDRALPLHQRATGFECVLLREGTAGHKNCSGERDHQLCPSHEQGRSQLVGID